MRKIFSAFTALMLTLVLALPGLAIPVLAANVERTDISDQFIDANFKAEVYKVIGKAPGQPIYDTDVAKITELRLYPEGATDVRGLDIENLNGIEYFINLKYLDCMGNLLRSLDISNNTKLEYLQCVGNQLSSLDISKNSALTYLGCSYNQITSLDVSKNTKLKSLYCEYNALTSLDVSKNLALENLECNNNQLTSLDVSKNLALEYLGCNYNQLTSLTIGNHPSLELLRCNNNQLTSLDVSKNINLTDLNCHNNQLSELDVTTNTKLEILYCSDNQLTSLDVSNNTALKILSCSYNLMPLEPLGLENLDLEYYEFSPQNTASAVDVSDKIGDVNFKTAIYELLEREQGLPIYNFELAGIKTLDVSGREIESLAGIKYFVGLQVLNCSNNLLTELYLNHNTQLRELDCSQNFLALTGIESLSELEIFNCSNNLLTELDLIYNTNLRELDCSHNLLAQPPTGINPSTLDIYVFDPQDITNLTLYLLIGGVALLALAGGVVLVFVMKRKKKATFGVGTELMAEPGAECESIAAPDAEAELIAAPEQAAAQDMESGSQESCTKK